MFLSELSIVCWIAQYCSLESDTSHMQTDQSEGEEWLDSDSEEELMSQSNNDVLQNFEDSQGRLKAQLVNYLLKKNLENVKDNIIVEVSRLLYLLDDQTLLTRMAGNRKFHRSLWNAVGNFGASVFDPSSTLLRKIQNNSTISDLHQLDTFRKGFAIPHL